MNFPAIALPFVAAACLVLPTGETRSLNHSQSSRETRASRVPFLIYVPDKLPATFELSSTNQSPETSTKVSKNPKKHGITTVEIIKSVEVHFNGTGNANTAASSSDTGDLLFSDTESKRRGNESSKQSTRSSKHNNRVKYRRIKASAILPLNNGTGNQESNRKPREESSKETDSLDFSSRILLGNILIRKSKDKIEDNKYSFFSEPKVSGNKYHATYINHNGSTTTNKSRINVKFPPKMSPLKNLITQQNRQNKTSSINNQISQTQKALYRSRFGKQTKSDQKNIQDQNVENESSPSEETVPQTQYRKEKQVLTHWDFGKKTPNDGDSIRHTTDVTSSINPNENDLSTNLPHLIHPTRSTLQPVEATTPKTIVENVIQQPRPQVIVQNAFPNHQSVPIFSNIQTIPVIPNVNSPQAYQIIQTPNGNVIRQNFGPQVFPNTQVHDFGNDIRGRNVEGINTRTLSSQGYIPPQHINVFNNGQQSEQQLAVTDVRNNWQPVYFVPHVTLPQQQQFPAVVTLQTVDTRGSTQNIPIIIQQQHSRSAHNLYQTAAVPHRPAVSTQNEIIYEGVLVTYPQEIQGEPSEIVPILIA